LGLYIAQKLKWRACCLIFRGCAGTEITTLRTYNGGYTEDVQALLSILEERYPQSPIGLVGYRYIFIIYIILLISLGGNVLAKLTGERNSKYRPILEHHHLKNNVPLPHNVKCAGIFVGINLTFLF
jgi:predicted alpha/beta-fold hydrolase